MEAHENKISMCVGDLNYWSWNVVGHVQKRLSKLEDRLKMVSMYNSLSIDMDKVRSWERQISSLLEWNEIMW